MFADNSADGKDKLMVELIFEGVLLADFPIQIIERFSRRKAEVSMRACVRVIDALDSCGNRDCTKAADLRQGLVAIGAFGAVDTNCPRSQYVSYQSNGVNDSRRFTERDP